jgi:protein translocase SecG subunit
MTILITFLTLVLVLNSFLLILLVLIQLPKKEAGAGLAFGGGATDALFGAGSGNALTKLTKYAAGFFLALSLTIGILNVKAHSGSSEIRRALANQKTTAPVTIPAAAATKPTGPFVPISGSNVSNAAITINTNAAAASTNTMRAVTTTNATAPAPAATTAPKTNAAAPK